jgi:hypothetical protein
MINKEDPRSWPLSSSVLARVGQTRERNEPAVAHSRGNVGISLTAAYHLDLCLVLVH